MSYGLSHSFPGSPFPGFPHPGLPGHGYPPPWWQWLVPASSGPEPAEPSPAAVAREVDSLLLALQPNEYIVRLLDEVDALAVVDTAVQDACDLVATELQPCFDRDEDGVLLQLLWVNAQELLAQPIVRAGVRRLLRAGPVLVAATRWQLSGRMRSTVLEAAGAELRSRRTSVPALDERLRAAERELATALPRQKGPLALAAIIVGGTAAMTYAADAVFHEHYGVHLWETTPH
ncbi:hypothetical protein [Plantactinospora sonchi]|uniref:Uncharacterized protein n=1 Tax=Plantactinospora sonchi TaxID=1544735 RepID=A0ABU7RUN4_9ACTN